MVLLPRTTSIQSSSLIAHSNGTHRIAQWSVGRYNLQSVSIFDSSRPRYHNGKDKWSQVYGRYFGGNDTVRDRRASWRCFCSIEEPSSSHLRGRRRRWQCQGPTSQWVAPVPRPMGYLMILLATLYVRKVDESNNKKVPVNKKLVYWFCNENHDLNRELVRILVVRIAIYKNASMFIPIFGIVKPMQG